VDIAHGELVEKELDQLITRRSKRKDPEEASAAWQRSAERYNTRRREEHRREWCDYFERLAGSLSARAEEYDQRAQTLMEEH
jgi:hypothetical protein